MAVTRYLPKPFEAGFRLIDGDFLNRTLAQPSRSTAAGIVALAGGANSGATPILSEAISELATVATAADSVKLAFLTPGQSKVVKNSGVAAAAIFPYAGQTLNGVATAATLAVGAIAEYVCISPNVVVLNAPSGAFTGTFDGIIGGVTPSSAAFTGASFSSGVTQSGSYTASGPESHTGVMNVTQAGRNMASLSTATGSTFAAYTAAMVLSTAASAYTLPVPVLGCEVEITQFGGSTQIMTVTTAAGTGILSSRMNNSAGSTDLTLMDHVLALTLAGQSVTLRGLSTYQWAVTAINVQGSTILRTTG